MRWDVVLLGAALAGALAWQARRDHARSRAWREQLFDGCRTLLARPAVRIDRTGWPVLEGEFEGRPVTCSLVFDDLGYRKLPILWFSLTVGVRIDVDASFDALAREQGTEFFSPAAELPVRLPLPEAWPRHVSLRADRESPLPLALAASGAQFFQSPQAKEIVLSPRGVRLVSLLAEGRRAEYLMLRRPRFDLERIDPAVVAARLADAHELVQALGAASDEQRRAA